MKSAWAEKHIDTQNTNLPKYKLTLTYKLQLATRVLQGLYLNLFQNHSSICRRTHTVHKERTVVKAKLVNKSWLSPFFFLFSQFPSTNVIKSTHIKDSISLDWVKGSRECLWELIKCTLCHIYLNVSGYLNPPTNSRTFLCCLLSKPGNFYPVNTS